MPNTLWFSPVCDAVYLKIWAWLLNYDKGVVESTCKFHDPVHGIIDRPTRYLHKLIFTQAEFDHLIRMLDAECENRPLVDEVKRIGKEVLPKGKLLLGTARMFEVAMYPEYIQLIKDTLSNIRNGKKKTIAEEVTEGGLF